MPRLLSALLAALAALAVGAGPTVVWAQERPQEPQELLLGLIVDGREAIVVDAYWDGREFLIPTEAFFEVCRCRRQEGTLGAIQVSTTLGSAELGAAAFVERNGVSMVREQALDSRLAVRIRYDPARLALVVDLPWGEERPEGTARATAQVADIRAPSASLSSALFRLQHMRQRGLASSSGSVTLAGRAAGGTWRGRYDDQFGTGGAAFAEYGWLRRFDDTLVLVGHQRVSMHPLMGAVEMTGVQTAWTNQPLDLFAPSSDPAELLPRRLRSAATIRGTGVPAGTAVLRVEERAVAAQVMGLDGRYEFRDVQLPSRGSQRIEVVVYGRHDPTVPVDLHDHSRTTGDDLLPGGAVVMQGGLGRAGNLADPVGDTAVGAGFYQARVGLSDGLTVEGAYQRGARGDRFGMAASGRLGSSLAAGVGAAVSDGSRAWMADVAGSWGGWRLSARSQMREAGFDAPFALGRAEHFGELSRRAAGGRLEVGVVAQVRDGYGDDRSFVLPWAYWRPDARMLLRARPDADGRYRLDASWTPTADWRLGVSRSGNHSVADLSWRIDDRFRAGLLAERVESGGHREAAVLTWSGEGRWAPSIAAGPLLANGRPGMLVSAQATLVPGVLAGARYEMSAALERPDGARDHRVSLILVGNLSFAGGRVVPGGFAGLDSRTGGIGGRLRIVDGYHLDPEVLEGVVILLDGQPATRTTRGGRFRIAQLPPGVYGLGFDPGRLPVELTPVGGSIAVEVVPGAVTRGDLWLEVELGVAGRVTVAGENAADLDVELVDAKGEVMARGTTDRFGLYRLDAVPRGTYRVRAVGAAALSDPVRLTNDFVFDADLTLDRAPAGWRQTVHPPQPRLPDLPPAPRSAAGLTAPMERTVGNMTGRLVSRTEVVARGPELVLVPTSPLRPVAALESPAGPYRHHERIEVVAVGPRPELVRPVVGPPDPLRLRLP